MSIKEDIEKVEKVMKEIEHESFAMEFLNDYKKSNKRMFVIIMVILTMWFCTIGYLIYVLNDIESAGLLSGFLGEKFYEFWNKVTKK